MCCLHFNWLKLWPTFRDRKESQAVLSKKQNYNKSISNKGELAKLLNPCSLIEQESPVERNSQFCDNLLSTCQDNNNSFLSDSKSNKEVDNYSALTYTLINKQSYANNERSEQEKQANMSFDQNKAAEANSIVNTSSCDRSKLLDVDQNNNDSQFSLKQHQESTFKIRTLKRRHLDFDEEFDLSDEKAPQRSSWSGPFYFIQAADCQFGMIDSYVHRKVEPGWKEEIQLCESLVKVCNELKPRPLFMIICGDLVDSLPGSEIGKKQVTDLKRIFSKLSPEIPLVCVCGNHDVGDEPTEKTLLDYRLAFGDDYFYFTKNDILFIVINSQFYQHRKNVEKLANEHDKWLENILNKCKLFKYSFIFEHIPWFLDNSEEEDDYFNITKEIRSIWLNKFLLAGVTKIFCGHYHRNAGAWLGQMELIVTSAIGAQLGNDKSGIRIVKVYQDSIKHQYYAIPDIPSEIKL